MTDFLLVGGPGHGITILPKEIKPIFYYPAGDMEHFKYRITSARSLQDGKEVPIFVPDSVELGDTKKFIADHLGEAKVKP